MVSITERVGAAMPKRRSKDDVLSPIVSFRGGDLLPEFAARGQTPGPVARRDLARYYDLLAEALQRVELTAAEARLLADVAAPLLDHAEQTGKAALPAHRWLWAELDNAMREQDERSRTSVADPSFVARIRALDSAASRALVDALERYRAALAGGEADSEDLLRRVGLIRP